MNEWWRNYESYQEYAETIAECYADLKAEHQELCATRPQPGAPQAEWDEWRARSDAHYNAGSGLARSKWQNVRSDTQKEILINELRKLGLTPEDAHGV